MRYELQVIVHRLDGTTQVEGTFDRLRKETDELPNLDELIDGIFNTVREHEGFAASFVITVVPKR
jgi:hypothetical protein